MKTKYLQLLLLAGFIFPVLSVAQTTPYRSYFGKEFTYWYTYYDGFQFDIYSKFRYVGKGDTILSNGISYKKLYDSRYYLGNMGFSCEISEYYCGIREESETGSLYLNIDGSSEILVSRMDLEIGDKYYFPPNRTDFNELNCWYYCFSDAQTDENGYYATVDSIYYKDDRKHIRLDVYYPANNFGDDEIAFTPLTFIEGIGPNISFEPLFSESSFEPEFNEWCWAVCFICYENENDLWKTDLSAFSDRECLFYISYGDISKINLDFPLKLIQRNGEIELQPDAGSFNSGWVYMYSMQGQLLYAKPVQGDANIIIPTSGFSKGAYIVRVIDEKTQKSRSVKVNI